MSIPKEFLDRVRDATVLSALVGRSVTLKRAGREHKGCCPFHNEKTASFTVNDDKSFWHCFGCGAHGDAIRWLTDHDNMDFLDAVKQLAEAAGLEVPAASPQAVEAARRIEGLRPCLEAAQGVYRGALNDAVIGYLGGRGFDASAIDDFALGFAGPRGNLRGTGITQRSGEAAGLLWERDGQFGERFIDRIMVPVRDARGKLIGFGGRDFSGREGVAKYINSPDSEIFDKSKTLFNLHRAAPHARPKAGNTGRLIVVEGYFDVIAMTIHDFPETVAPMGTALTGEQVKRLWRVHASPVLLFDGDDAGRKAAVRACMTALPFVGPAGTLRVASLPADMDPDDMLRLGRRAGVEVAISMAAPMSEVLFDAVLAEATANAGIPLDLRAVARGPLPPEAVSAIWYRLEEMAGSIEDAETQRQYLGVWRARFEREVSAVPSVTRAVAVDAYTLSDDGKYAWPESEDAAERRLVLGMQHLLDFRAQKRAIAERERELLSMFRAMGYSPQQMRACAADIEADPATREEKEMVRALYRRVLGIKGPMTEAMLPESLPDGLPRAKRLASADGMTMVAGRGGVRPAKALAWHDIDVT